MFQRKDGRVTGSLFVEGLPKKAKVPGWVGGLDEEAAASSTGGELAEQIREDRERQREGEVPEAASAPELIEEREQPEPAKPPAKTSGGSGSTTTKSTSGTTAKGR